MSSLKYVLIGLGILALLILIICLIVYIRKNISFAKISKAEEKSKGILQDASKEAENTKKEAILEAKEEVHKLRSDSKRNPG